MNVMAEAEPWRRGGLTEQALEVRLGRPADLPGVALLWARAQAARLGRPLPEHPGERELGLLASRLSPPGSWLLVAVQGSRVVGMAVGLLGRDRFGKGPVIPGLLHLSSVAVDPELWGQGIGGALLDMALDQARRRGHSRVQLWTQADNWRARRLYESRGFRPTGASRIDEWGEQIIHHIRG